MYRRNIKRREEEGKEWRGRIRRKTEEGYKEEGGDETRE
jgi:hypothetical protein